MLFLGTPRSVVSLIPELALRRMKHTYCQRRKKKLLRTVCHVGVSYSAEFLKTNFQPNSVFLEVHFPPSEGSCGVFLTSISTQTEEKIPKTRARWLFKQPLGSSLSPGSLAVFAWCLVRLYSVLIWGGWRGPNFVSASLSEVEPGALGGAPRSSPVASCATSQARAPCYGLQWLERVPRWNVGKAWGMAASPRCQWGSR